MVNKNMGTETEKDGRRLAHVIGGLVFGCPAVWNLIPGYDEAQGSEQGQPVGGGGGAHSSGL